MGIKNALINRPVRVLGFVAAMHTVVYGIGLSLGLGGFGETFLYTALGPASVVYTFSASLVVTGALLAFAYVRNNPKTIRDISGVCGTVWLFATLLYLLHGAWLLAIGIGLPWMVLAYYLAFAHGNRREIMAYDQTSKAKQDTLDEDRL